MKKYLILSVLLTAAIFGSCKKETEPAQQGTITVNQKNDTYGTNFLAVPFEVTKGSITADDIQLKTLKVTLASDDPKVNESGAANLRLKCESIKEQEKKGNYLLNLIILDSDIALDVKPNYFYNIDFVAQLRSNDGQTSNSFDISLNNSIRVENSFDMGQTNEFTIPFSISPTTASIEGIQIKGSSKNIRTDDPDVHEKSIELKIQSIDRGKKTGDYLMKVAYCRYDDESLIEIKDEYNYIFGTTNAMIINQGGMKSTKLSISLNKSITIDGDTIKMNENNKASIPFTVKPTTTVINEKDLSLIVIKEKTTIESNDATLADATIELRKIGLEADEVDGSYSMQAEFIKSTGEIIVPNDAYSYKITADVQIKNKQSGMLSDIFTVKFEKAAAE